MSAPRRVLDCGCTYELKRNNEMSAFSSDITLWCTYECAAADALLEVWCETKDDAALEAYYDHVWSGLVGQRTQDLHV